MVAGIARLAVLPLVLAVPSVSRGSDGWKAAGWGGGGLYWACAFHPARDGTMYLGGDVNGFYKSTDHGKRWRISNSGLGHYAVYSMAVDAVHPDTVYLGTPGGAYRSADAGENWTFLPDTAPGRLGITAVRELSVRALAVHPGTGDVYAGTPSGKVFRSEDGGRTWNDLRAPVAGGGVASVAVAAGKHPAVLAATTRTGLLLSEDGGKSWTRLATPGGVSHTAFASRTIMYAACGPDGVWKSADRGRTWAPAGTGIAPKCAIREIAVDPGSPRTVHAIGNEGWNGFFYRSADGGGTWTLSSRLAADRAGNPTLPEEPGVAAGEIGLSKLTNLAVNPNDPRELFVSGNWRTGYSADGGKTWEERDAGADITCVTDIRFLDGNTYVTAMDEGLLVSPDGGGSWRQLVPLKYSPEISGHQWRVLAWKGPGGAVNIASTCSPWNAPGNAVLLSRDAGASFTAVREGLPAGRPRPNTMWSQGYARALAADPRNPDVLYLGIDGDPEPGKEGTGGGVFKSLDGGKSWKRLARQPGSRRVFYGLAVDPTDPDRVFWAACGDGGGLHRSDDGGKTWKHVFRDESWSFNVAVSPSGIVYCPGSNLWRSRDHGTTWEKISDFPGGLSIVGLALHPEDDGVIWISKVSWGTDTGGGVYKTSDGGATWEEITGDIPNRKPLVLRFNPATSELWAGGTGLYRLKQ